MEGMEEELREEEQVAMKNFFWSPAVPFNAKVRNFLRQRTSSVSSVTSNASLASETQRKLAIRTSTPKANPRGSSSQLVAEEEDGGAGRQDTGYDTEDFSGIEELFRDKNPSGSGGSGGQGTGAEEGRASKTELPQKKYRIEGSKTVLTEGTWKAMHALPAIELGKLRDLSARNAPLIPPRASNE